LPFVKILTSLVFEKHKPPDAYHPENHSRIKIALSAVENLRDSVEVELRDAVDRSGLLKEVHDDVYVEYVRRLAAKGFRGYIDSDTYINGWDSWIAAVTAFELSSRAAEIAVSMGGGLVFALVRPPGHHTGRAGRALGAPTQGFCIFNNAAAAALTALRMGLKPVLVLDFDLHHGNGTQEIFWCSPDVIHVDLHEDGIYPGTGGVEDTGGAEGTKINIPLRPGARDDDYIYALTAVLKPLTDFFKPRFIVVSAGFDAYTGDGLGDLNLTERSYRCTGAIVKSVVTPVVAILEGGYSVGLEMGLPAFIEGYIGEDLETCRYNPESVSKATRSTVKRLGDLLKSIHGLDLGDV